MTDRVATIEIGHTYAPERLARLCGTDNGEYVFADTLAANRLREVANELAPHAMRVALIDDVAVRQKQRESEDSLRWQMFINASHAGVEFGTQAEFVVFESTFEKQGREIVESIQQHELPGGYRVSQNGRNLLHGSGKTRSSAPLQGFEGIDDPTHPSCAVLDLAWLRYRLTLAPQAITVLEKGFEKQQHQVALLSGLFRDMDPNRISTVFIDPVAPQQV